MISVIKDVYDDIIGIHRTFLEVTNDGNVLKADVDSPKKILGSLKGGFCPFGDITGVEEVHVAEGVETSEQLNILQGMNCEATQGYLFSKPGPPDKISKLLNSKLGA